MNDPEAKAGIRDVVADISGVPAGYIVVTLSIVRRLAGRTLASSGGVKVVYVISVPTTLLGSSDMPSLASISKTLGAAAASLVTGLINTELADLGYPAVSVSNWQTPVTTTVNSSEEVASDAHAAGSGGWLATIATFAVALTSL